MLVYSWCGQAGLLATIFSTLAALPIKTRLDSCPVLSAGWLAAFAVLLLCDWKKEGFSWLQWIISQMQKPLLHDEGGAGLLGPSVSGISVKAEEIKWPISPVSHAGCWPGLWVIQFMSIILLDLFFSWLPDT